MKTTLQKSLLAVSILLTAPSTLYAAELKCSAHTISNAPAFTKVINLKENQNKLTGSHLHNKQYGIVSWRMIKRDSALTLVGTPENGQWYFSFAPNRDVKGTLTGEQINPQGKSVRSCKIKLQSDEEVTLICKFKLATCSQQVAASGSKAEKKQSETGKKDPASDKQNNGTGSEKVEKQATTATATPRWDTCAGKGTFTQSPFVLGPDEIVNPNYKEVFVRSLTIDKPGGFSLDGAASGSQRRGASKLEEQMREVCALSLGSFGGYGPLGLAPESVDLLEYKRMCEGGVGWEHFVANCVLRQTYFCLEN